MCYYERTCIHIYICTPTDTPKDTPRGAPRNRNGCCNHAEIVIMSPDSRDKGKELHAAT
jgi:hypothetical protein